MRIKLLLLFAIIGICLGMAHPGLAAETPKALLPGIYQPGDVSATALVEPQSDASLLLRLWQGGEAGYGGGFAYLGRLVATPGGKRLAGMWQALPGSCCPGRGRQEIEVLGPESFRFTLFATTLDRQAWGGDPKMIFRRVAGLPPSEPSERLAGTWRISYWYTKLLPSGVPSDLVQGKLELTPQGEGLQGKWEGMPGKASLTPTSGGAVLDYHDPQAGFELRAQLAEEASGLSLVGVFTSTLGQGQISLTRQGLPAVPPGPQVSQEGNLSGVWVDTRTGSDFFKITGSDKGFSFLAYGGSLSQPRYLSKGQAAPTGPERLQGQAQDQPGQCCGNQGSFDFRRLEPNRLEVTAAWWPLGQPKPPNLKGETFSLERVSQEQAAAAATLAGWPQVIAPRSDLPGPASGAVEASFNPGPGNGQPRTIFSQGGYGHRLELYLDGDGYLCALIDTPQGPLQLRSSSVVTNGQEHIAWLIWEAGGQVRLYLDGSEVAAAPLAEPWKGSSAPYLVGGSRWPGRQFQGAISEVRLWPQAETPSAPHPAGPDHHPGGGPSRPASRPPGPRPTRPTAWCACGIPPCCATPMPWTPRASPPGKPGATARKGPSPACGTSR